MKRNLRAILFAVICICLALPTVGWMLGVGTFLTPLGLTGTVLLLCALLAGEFYAARRLRTRWAAAALHVLALALAVSVWAGTVPRNDREWMPECRIAPTATVDGNIATIHNFRNFAYAGSAIADERYETRTYNIDDVTSVDFVISYFGSDAIAHTFLSFGFATGEQVAVSVEIRKEKGERFAPVAGCFRQYELIYIIGDERDLIGVRLYQRREDVYLYRTNVTPQDARTLFMDYLNAANRLAETPAFYNTVTANCTTTILDRIRSFWPVTPPRYAVLLNGRVDRLAYASGALDQSLPFEDLRARSYLNPQMPASAAVPDFSRQLRTPPNTGVADGGETGVDSAP